MMFEQIWQLRKPYSILKGEKIKRKSIKPILMKSVFIFFRK